MSLKKTNRVLNILKELGDCPDVPVNLPPVDAALFATNGHLAEHPEDDGERVLPHCHDTGKVCYPFEKQARQTMRRRQFHGAQRLRVYFCPSCKSYHLTSYA
jgi:hypothetical protein